MCEVSYCVILSNLLLYRSFVLARYELTRNKREVEIYALQCQSRHQQCSASAATQIGQSRPEISVTTLCVVLSSLVVIANRLLCSHQAIRKENFSLFKAINEVRDNDEANKMQVKSLIIRLSTIHSSSLSLSHTQCCSFCSSFELAKLST